MNVAYDSRFNDNFRDAIPGIRVLFHGGRLSQQVHKIMAERRGGKYLVDLVVGSPNFSNLNLKSAGVPEPFPPAWLLIRARLPGSL